MKNNLIDINYTQGNLEYCFESDSEYRTIEVDDIKIAKTIGLNVTYSERYDEYYIDGIIAEEYEFTNTELVEYLEATMTEAPEPEATKVRRSVMATAWTMFKTGLYDSFAIALKTAWNKIKLSKRLQTGIAYFSFKKVDGSIRDAIGTLRSGNFDYVPKSNSTRPVNQLSYWDVEKRGWRSLKIENLITIK